MQKEMNDLKKQLLCKKKLGLKYVENSHAIHITKWESVFVRVYWGTDPASVRLVWVWTVDLISHPSNKMDPEIGGPQDCDNYLQEFDQFPMVNIREKSPCASLVGRKAKTPVGSMPEHTTFFLTRLALRENQPEPNQLGYY